MKANAIVCAIMAMSLTSAGAAFGQDRWDRNDRGRNEQAQRAGQQDRRANDARQPMRHEDRSRVHDNERRDERGAGPNHQFYKRNSSVARDYCMSDGMRERLRRSFQCVCSFYIASHLEQRRFIIFRYPNLSLAYINRTG